MDMRADKLEEVVFCFVLEWGKRNVFQGSACYFRTCTLSLEGDDDDDYQSCPDLLLVQACNTGDDQAGSNCMLLLWKSLDSADVAW